MNKPKQINLGFMKIERHIESDRPKPKFIEVQRKPEPFKPNIESKVNITILPKSVVNAAKAETIKEGYNKAKNYLSSIIGRIFGKKQVKQDLQSVPKSFLRIIKDINVFFDNIIIFEALITAFALFLLGYVILMIFKQNEIYSVLAPLIYLIAYVSIKMKQNKYLEVEKKFPFLNERIRTAVDSLNATNPVVDELRNEVSFGIRQADYASFFKEKKVSLKILLVIILCFGVIFLAKYDVSFDLGNLKNRVFGFVQGNDGNITGIVSDIITATLKGSDDDIYGEESLAKLGNQDLTISINKVGYELNMNDVKDPSLKDFEESLFPDDIGLTKSEIYSKEILKENQELVKNYFKNMAQG